MENIDISRILVDGRNSYDVMYAEIFTKLGLERERFSNYMSVDIQFFKILVTCI